MAAVPGAEEGAGAAQRRAMMRAAAPGAEEGTGMARRRVAARAAALGAEDGEQQLWAEDEQQVLLR